MANSKSNPDQIDRLSALPDALLVTVLSLLPTCKAASTSVISRRFRHLWKSSPSGDLSIEYLPFNRSTYVSMANSALLSCSSSNHLLRLHLDLDYPVSSYNLTDSFFCFLLVHAHALGLRHLTIDGYCEPVLRSVFSISSLESLSISIRPRMACPSAMTLICLKNLSINLTSYSSSQVQRLLSELCCLEYLQLRMYCGVDCLSSRTIKKLELLLFDTSPEPYSLGLSMPSLEFLSLKNLSIPADIPLIHGEIPFIRKVVVTFDCLREKHVTAVAQFLNCISHVEELSLDLKENIVFDDYPFPVLLKPGKEMPTFSNLKHLDLSIRFHEYNFEAVVMMLHRCSALESLQLHHQHLDLSICFHEYNFETVVTMLHHCTELESLRLHHKPSDMLAVKRRKRIFFFKNLHLGEERMEKKSRSC